MHNLCWSYQGKNQDLDLGLTLSDVIAFQHLFKSASDISTLVQIVLSCAYRFKRLEGSTAADWMLV